MRARGEDPQRNLARSIAADNAVVRALPGATFGIHLCRGNAAGMWHRRGSYDAIAEQLFGTLAHARFLLEYDDERSGGFEPLRFVPQGQGRGAGADLDQAGARRDRSTSCAGASRKRRAISRSSARAEPAMRLRVGAGRQPAHPDDQWRKIDVMMQTAQLVWGS